MNKKGWLILEVEFKFKGRETAQRRGLPLMNCWLLEV